MLLLVCTGKSSLRLCLNWVRFWQLKEAAHTKQGGGYKSCCVLKGQVPCGTFERAAEVGTKVKAKASEQSQEPYGEAPSILAAGTFSDGKRTRKGKGRDLCCITCSLSFTDIIWAPEERLILHLFCCV